MSSSSFRLNCRSSRNLQLLRVFVIAFVLIGAVPVAFSLQKNPAVLAMFFQVDGEVPAEDAVPPTDTGGVETEPVEAEPESSIIEDPLGSELVEVNWLEELYQGGVTMILLGILSIGLVAILLERFFTLRPGKFVPPALISKVRPLYREGKFNEIRAACDAHPSTAAEIIRHLVDYRDSDFEIIQGGAADIGGRVVVDQEERCNPLSVIAGVAPLLGLLGTMIGMIESFKLVEVFGDEGGASLLAGSISKALITTAVGLVLAIPAVLVYHWARRRVHYIATVIEIESESLLKLWFMNKVKDAEQEAAAKS